MPLCVCAGGDVTVVFVGVTYVALGRAECELKEYGGVVTGPEEEVELGFAVVVMGAFRRVSSYDESGNTMTYVQGRYSSSSLQRVYYSQTRQQDSTCRIGSG